MEFVCVSLCVCECDIAAGTKQDFLMVYSVCRRVLGKISAFRDDILGLSEEL